MPSKHGNAFHITGPLCGESTAQRLIPNANGRNVQLWYVSVNTLQNKQSSCRWSETLWHPCGVTVKISQLIRLSLHSTVIGINVVNFLHLQHIPCFIVLCFVLIASTARCIFMRSTCIQSNSLWLCNCHSNNRSPRVIVVNVKYTTR